MTQTKCSSFATALYVALLMVASASGQDLATGQTAPDRTAPRTIKKTYTPASVLARPELQCQVYPAGASPSSALTVFTDDDGYARFHAVRAEAGDKVQRLTLDCTDTNGNPTTYSADLTSDETFAPHPINLANERGTDRPPLTGDPLSYSQSELIQAGYGLRPDPSDAGPYARWLAAARRPGRFLEVKRPHARPQTLPAATIKDGPWTGSIMNGAPKYLSIEAYFSVPTAIPSGDETANTEISIWDGLGGYNANNGSGLIQGGVFVQTTPSIALYGAFREFCCGQGISNGYASYIPSPGDEIYSQNWYCDKNGNINISGGYGCSYVDDVTSGAILNCVSPTGTSCWSVPNLPLCSKDPSDPNCMTLGKSAEFIIENQTSGPFPDFTPTVDIYGSAYSSTTGSYSQTVTNDPKVTTLVDYTNTTSHMVVALGTTNETYFTSSQFLEVGGTGLNALVPCPTGGGYCYPQSIGVGPGTGSSPSGVAWVLGTAKNSGGDYYVYEWENGKFVRTGGAGLQIAVSPQGVPWVITHTGEIYYWNGSTFKVAPGGGCATSIGVGPNAYGSQYGDPWVIGCGASEVVDGGIFQLQGSTWVQQPGAANRIAVSPEGVPWVLTANGNIYYWGGSYFLLAPAGCANSIAVGPTTAPLASPYGDAWIVGCGNVNSGGAKIFQLQNNAWVQIPGDALQVGVSPDLGVPWLVTLSGQIFE